MVSGVNINVTFKQPNRQPTKKPKKKTGLGYSFFHGANSFFDKILRAIFVTFLFILDFVMFIYSINGKLFEDGSFNEAVLWIFCGVFGIAVILMLLLSFSSLAQNIFCAIFTLVMTLIFFNQFALFDVNTFIELWLEEHASALTFIGIIPSSFLVGLILGAVVLFSFCYTLPMLLICLAIVSSVILGVVQAEFKHVLPKTEYVVTKELNGAVAPKRENSLVYMMLPKFPSYHFLSTVKDINFRELRDLMVGFYAVNDFEIYPNAFVQKNDTVSNIVDIYNQVDYTSTTSGIRGYAEILNDWNFLHGILNNYGLEDNLLYQALKQDGYTISTYTMPGFNLCYNKDALVSDRCVEKAYKVVKLYDKKATLERNIYALLGEWVLSINNRELQDVAKMLINSSSLRGFKVISQNRRVSIEGSPALFEQMGTDYSKDKIGTAYMAYVDLPSDIYMYDQYCNIKPRKEWIAAKDNSLFRGGIDAKRKAYADQSKCLIGMMQMFMEDFLRDEKHNKTDIVVQGVSTIKEFAGMTAGAYNNFVADKLVSMGVRKAKAPAFLVNTKVCLASDITKSLISGKEYCYTVENMRMSTDEMFNLQQNLINNAVIRGSKITNIVGNYRDWYEEFKNNSPYYRARREKAIEELVRQQMEREEEARRAYLRGERAEPVPTPVAAKPEPIIEDSQKQEDKTIEPAVLAAQQENEVAAKPVEDVKQQENEAIAKPIEDVKQQEEANTIEPKAADEIIEKSVEENEQPQEKTAGAAGEQNAQVTVSAEQVSVPESQEEEKTAKKELALENNVEAVVEQAAETAQPQEASAETARENVSADVTAADSPAQKAKDTVKINVVDENAQPENMPAVEGALNDVVAEKAVSAKEQVVRSGETAEIENPVPAGEVSAATDLAENRE